MHVRFLDEKNHDLEILRETCHLEAFRSVCAGGEEGKYGAFAGLFPTHASEVVSV